MPEAGRGLTFFIDRGIGSRIVPNALRAAGWTLVTMDELYGTLESQRTDDVDWIAEAADRGEVSICKDTAVASNPEEAQTIYMHAARVFAFANKHLTGQQMADLLLRWQSEIWSISERAAGPYVFAISDHRPHRRRLRYPPP